MYLYTFVQMYQGRGKTEDHNQNKFQAAWLGYVNLCVYIITLLVYSLGDCTVQRVIFEAFIFREFHEHSQSSKIKIVKKQLMWEEAWFSISIREITFREQELNWLFAKYKRLENNPLYGMFLYVDTLYSHCTCVLQGTCLGTFNIIWLGS